MDLNFAEKAIEIDGIIKGRLFEQAKELTGLDNPKSTAQLKGWIEDTAGIEVESLNKKVLLAYEQKQIIKRLTLCWIYGQVFQRLLLKNIMLC